MPVRTALVTGGMGGLGQAIVASLHDAGARIVVTVSAQNHHAQAWLEERRRNGFEVWAYPVDVSDFDSCDVAVKRIRAEVGPIDILVNNAGITRDATVRKMSRADWTDVLRTDLDSAFNVTQPLLADMIERRWGRIINISSVNGQRGQIGQANYAAAKAGLHGFTMSLALELARYEITVNTLTPGYFDTKMVAAVPKDVMEKHILPQIPLGRLGRPEEVGALAAFLASDAAGYITGANFAINGGLHMQ